MATSIFDASSEYTWDDEPLRGFEDFAFELKVINREIANILGTRRAVKRTEALKERITIHLRELFILRNEAETELLKFL